MVPARMAGTSCRCRRAPRGGGRPREGQGLRLVVPCGRSGGRFMWSFHERPGRGGSMPHDQRGSRGASDGDFPTYFLDACCSAVRPSGSPLSRRSSSRPLSAEHARSGLLVCQRALAHQRVPPASRPVVQSPEAVRGVIVNPLVSLDPWSCALPWTVPRHQTIEEIARLPVVLPARSLADAPAVRSTALSTHRPETRHFDCASWGGGVGGLAAKGYQAALDLRFRGLDG